MIHLALLLAIAVFGLASGSFLLSALFAGAALLSLGLRFRSLELGARGEMILALVVIVASALLSPLIPRLVTDNSVGGEGHALGLACLLLAITRGYLPRPRLGAAGTLALALIAVAAYGRSARQPAFIPLAVAFVIALLLALRQSDPHRAPVSTFDRRAWMIPISTLFAAVLIAFGIGRALPPLHNYVLDGFGMDFEPPVEMSGFSDKMKLGSMKSALESDKVVLRVYGDRLDRLRGIVYSTYDDGRWFAAPKVESAARSQPGRATTRIEMARASRDPYFVPLQAGGVHTKSGNAVRDSMGLWRPAGAGDNAEISIEASARDPEPIADPIPDDARVPSHLAEPLAAISHEWTRGATTAAEKLDAISARLEKDYLYSLTFERTPLVDPIVDFLTRHKSGHCEYFASAMTLLARTHGIAARVVGGFKLMEHNDLGNYDVVRERHAHAWVEAFVPGRGWVTYDPSPLFSDVAERRSSGTFAGLKDLLMTWLSAAKEKLLALDFVLLAAALLGLAGLGVAVRRLRTRGRSRQPRARAHPIFAVISAELGVARPPSETLEAFAERLRALESDRAGAWADLVTRYAALRYGGVGDAAQLEQDIRQTRQGA